MKPWSRIIRPSSVVKMTRATRSGSRERTSHKPLSSFRTSGIPSGQPNCTVLMSSPMMRRSSRGRDLSHSRAGPFHRTAMPGAQAHRRAWRRSARHRIRRGSWPGNGRRNLLARPGQQLQPVSWVSNLALLEQSFDEILRLHWLLLSAHETSAKSSGSRNFIHLRLHRPRTNVAWRTEKQSPPENTRCRVVPSVLIHFDGKLAESPGPTSQRSVK